MPDTQPRYVVYKASRIYRGGPGYLGPSWDRAGLPLPTTPFYTRRDAKIAARKLKKVNPVGFLVAQYIES